MAVGKFNADNYPDLVTATGGVNVKVLLNTGSGTFGAAMPHSAGVQPYGLATGDFTGDGYDDIATANWNYNSVSVLRSNGTGSFAVAVVYPVGTAP